MQVLNVQVSTAVPLPLVGVALRPTESTGLVFDGCEIQAVQCTLRMRPGCKVDVGIAQGLPGDRVSADANRGNGSHGVEDAVEHRLCDILPQISTIKGAAKILQNR